MVRIIDGNIAFARASECALALARNSNNGRSLGAGDWQDTAKDAAGE